MDLNKLMRDEEFKAAIERAENCDDIVRLLKGKGIEISAKQVEEVFNSKSGEMDEAELESVSGGGWLSSLWKYINAVRYKAGGGGFSSGGGGKGSFGGGGFFGGGGR